MRRVKLDNVEYEFLGNDLNEACEKLNDILNVDDDRDFIYICHPRHVFDYYEESTKKEIVNVKWSHVDIEMMFSYDDFGSFSIVEQVFDMGTNPLSYIRKRVSHMIKKYCDDGNFDYVVPLAILVERVDVFDNSSDYFAKGIISFDKDGVKLAMNPEYVQKKFSQEVLSKHKILNLV